MQLDTNPPAGTRDFLPGEVARRQRALGVIREVFEAYGFAGMDTPAFERIETLLGKYGEEGDQLIFRILARGEKLDEALAADHVDVGDVADHALRYDLTVPLARYVAANAGQLVTPFKRYAIAPVWRADRPGRGRYREFLQCDVDITGSDSLLADAEVLLAVIEVLDALGLDGFTMRLNSRRALRGLVEAYGIPVEQEASALVAIDKLDKIGVDGVAAELTGRGVAPVAVTALVEDLGHDDLAGALRERIAGTELGAAGLAEVDTVLELVTPNMAGGALAFDPVLARGLSYYTGPVFEVAHAGLGASIAGGGRYDGLVGMFSKNDIPATGGSLGMERILLLLEEQDDAAAAAPPVLVTVLGEELRGDALAIATRLRREGAIHTDVYVADKKLGKQFRYADDRGVRFVVIRGSDERDAGEVSVKELATGEQVTVAEDDLVAHLRARL
jgi:histidyl-tRNA synthetase